MKQLLIFLVILQLSACKKENDAPRSRVRNFTIKEYKTNTPLEGIYVSLFCCGKYDMQFGCLYDVQCQVFTTDANGKTSIDFAQHDDIRKVTAGGNGFWDQNAIPDTTTYLDRKGSAFVNLIPVQNYPASAYILITVKGERGQFYNASDFMPAPHSTQNINLKTIAGQINSVEWKIFQNEYSIAEMAKGKIENISVPLTGTISFDLNF